MASSVSDLKTTNIKKSKNTQARKQLEDVLAHGLKVPHPEWNIYREGHETIVFQRTPAPTHGPSGCVSPAGVVITSITLFAKTFRTFAKNHGYKLTVISRIYIEGEVRPCTKLDWHTTRPKGMPLPIDDFPESGHVQGLGSTAGYGTAIGTPTSSALNQALSARPNYFETRAFSDTASRYIDLNDLPF